MHKLFISLSKDGSKFLLDQRTQSRYSDVWTPSWTVDTRWMQDLPEWKILHGKMECAATDAAITVIQQRDIELDLEPDAQIVWDFLSLIIQNAEVNARVVADFKLSGIVPDGGYDYGKLSAYQKPGTFNAVRSPGYGLFMKQGTGKTATAIAAICNDAKPGQKYRAIVVCPNNVRTNWQKEVAEFATKPLKVTILRGGQVQRLSQIIDAVRAPEDISLIVCSYDTMQQSWDALSNIKFDMAILDEAQFIKSSATKRYKYAIHLRNNSARRLVLTGTPVANSVMDLFALFEFMGAGYSGFSTFEGFKKYFGRYRRTDYGDQLEAAQNLPILKERIARYAYVVTKEEALPYLPDKTYDTIEVEMTEEQQAAYETLRDELVIEIENTLDASENEAVAVNNALTQLLRLSQITSGFKVVSAIIDPNGGGVISPRRVAKFAANPKVNAILELIKEKGPDDKTIIWSNYVEDIQATAAALTAAGEQCVTFYGQTQFDEREVAEWRFNNDVTCKWFIGNPSAGGTGLNLRGHPGNDESITTNCTHVVYFSQDWSALKREQSEDRAHRRGTRAPVRITELRVPNTIDDVIAERVLAKRLNAMEVLDVREILNNVRNLACLV